MLYLWCLWYGVCKLVRVGYVDMMCMCLVWMRGYCDECS